MSAHFSVEDSSGDAASQWRTLRTLGSYLWPEGRSSLRMRVLAALFCLFLAKAINVGIPFLYKGAVDALTADNPALLVVPVSLIVSYGIARLFTVVFAEIRDLLFIPVAQFAQRTIALNTFKHLHGLSLAFHLDRQTGGLSRVIERGTRGIQFVLSFMLFNIVPTILELLLVTGILMVTFGPFLALTTLFTIVIYIAFTLITTNWRLRFRREMNKNDSEANTKAIDSLLNYETVKYFCNEEHEYGRYDKALSGYETAAVKSQNSLSLLNCGQGAIIAIGLVIVMWDVAAGVASGNRTIGDFVLVNTYLIQLYLPLNFLGFVYREMRQSLTDMEKMFELLHVDGDVKDKPSAPPIRLNGGEVAFNNVSFRYHPERPILRDVSFSVPAGNQVAIVGPSGSGKSTISRLLYRFYEVKEGIITVDGQDIQQVQQRTLRKAIGIVPQDTVLFNDTVLYNIRYGRPEATREEVVQAAQLARIDGFVQTLPDGYDTMVGERGLKLSGGEKQRVAIARAILKNPCIMIFDEATSALDSQTEKEIQKSLKEVARNRTTLVIAHRLSTVVDADEILVLDKGQIVERGRHQELLAADGMYAEMWRKQQEAARYEQKLDAL